MYAFDYEDAIVSSLEAMFSRFAIGWTVIVSLGIRDSRKFQDNNALSFWAL